MGTSIDYASFLLYNLPIPTCTTCIYHNYACMCASVNKCAHLLEEPLYNSYWLLHIKQHPLGTISDQIYVDMLLLCR